MFTSPHALVSFGTFLKRVSSFASTYVSASATRNTVSSRTLSKGGSSRYLMPRVFSDVNFRSQSCILFRKIKVNPYYTCLRHPMKVTKGERVFLDIQCLIQIRACDLKIGKTPDSIESRFFGSYRDCQKVWFFLKEYLPKYEPSEVAARASSNSATLITALFSAWITVNICSPPMCSKCLARSWS